MTDTGVMTVSQFDEGRNDYDGDLSSSADIITFVKANSLPLVSEFSDEVNFYIYVFRSI